ncbi:MAG: hypothetical protein M3277_02180 [Actinomycetota bacterium]|nr:hypothetical protein [Actinomycetota bacterium]
MGTDLDLYGRGSTPRARLDRRAVIASGLVVIMLAGLAGYRWLTNTTPVSAAQALDIFRAEQDEAGASTPGGPSDGRSDEVASNKRTSQHPTRKTGRPAAVAAPQRAQPATGAGTRRTTPSDPNRGTATAAEDRSPEEGVYSWDTEGYEEAGGTRRSLPEESQRIITHHRSGWKQHHYFSEQREIWTTFEVTERGAEISYQRNRVVFGPITNDSFIDFAPPMLVGPGALEVGQTWTGSWEGETYGTYEGKTFERVTLDIGGREVEAFGVQVDIHLRGEQRGDVIAKVWIAPEYAMTVKEHFVQSVRAGVGTYHAEWTITLKSLEPRR